MRALTARRSHSLFFVASAAVSIGEMAAVISFDGQPSRHDQPETKTFAQ
ncbi:hypothetical protein [Paraburkholderia sp.]|nr:hypothetical protein [Paraburkholderia sp.]MDE1179638.1 hypothetical protein [Paraburkholderia sp.]